MLVISLLSSAPSTQGSGQLGNPENSWKFHRGTGQLELLLFFAKYAVPAEVRHCDPHQDGTAQYSLLQRSWSKTCQTSTTWISPNRVQLRSHHIKRTFLKNPIPQNTLSETTKDRRMVPWNMPLRTHVEPPWCPDVPWPRRTTEEWHHSACRPALRAMRSSSPRLGRMTRHFSRRSNWMGSLHVYQYLREICMLVKEDFHALALLDAGWSLWNFGFTRKKWCVYDGNFWGYLGVWKSVSLFWMEWGTAFSEVYLSVYPKIGDGKNYMQHQLKLRSNHMEQCCQPNSVRTVNDMLPPDIKFWISLDSKISGKRTSSIFLVA
jgi:hypothetical protein